MARSAVLTGRTLADLVRNLGVVAIMVAVGLLVGFRPTGSVPAWLAGFGLLMLFCFAFSWIGAYIGLMVPSVEAAQSAGFIWLFPLTFASSAFVAPATMPAGVQWFAEHQPVSQVVDTLRAILLAQPVGDSWGKALAWCGAILVVFMPLAVSRYRRATAG